MPATKIFQLNNGVTMPSVGLGVYQSSPEETLEAVTAALDAGYRLIDTAAAYGNEREVGEAIRGSGVAREDIFVTTKLWLTDFGYDEALRAFDRSIGKLGLDTLDLYLLHFPMTRAFERTVGAWRAVEQLLQEGRIRAIGVSNFSADDLDTLAANSTVTPTVNQVELHPYFGQPDLREAHEKSGIITQAWSPIGGISRYRDGDLQDPLVDPVITRLADRHGKSPAQIVLRWHLEHGICVIPKSVREARIRENFDLFDFALTAPEVAAIDALDAGARGGPPPETVDDTTFDFTIDD